MAEVLILRPPSVGNVCAHQPVFVFIRKPGAHFLRQDDFALAVRLKERGVAIKSRIGRKARGVARGIEFALQVVGCPEGEFAVRQALSIEKTHVDGQAVEPRFGPHLAAGRVIGQTCVLERKAIEFVYAAELIVEVKAHRHRPPAESVTEAKAVEAAVAFVQQLGGADMGRIVGSEIGRSVRHLGIGPQIKAHLPPFEQGKKELHVAKAAARALVAQAFAVHLLRKRIHGKRETDVEQYAQRINAHGVRSGVKRAYVALARKPYGNAAHAHGTGVEIRHLAPDTESGIGRERSALRLHRAKGKPKEQGNAENRAQVCFICCSPKFH